MVKIQNSKKDMTQLFMNTVYYELQHTKVYNGLVKQINGGYKNKTSVQSMFKALRKHKHSFKNKKAYKDLKSVVNEYLKRQIQTSKACNVLFRYQRF